MANQAIELPKLTIEQKWKTAESNLIYFVVSGIAYAKSRGASPEDFGTFAGQVAAPSWKEDAGKGPQALVAGISQNKQQFRDFQLEIQSVSETTVQARMKGFGESDVRTRPRHEITVDDYIRFFEKKWEVIADSLGLEYKQRVERDWTIFTVSQKT
jgi:hypothetical protein